MIAKDKLKEWTIKLIGAKDDLGKMFVPYTLAEHCAASDGDLGHFIAPDKCHQNLGSSA